MIDLSIGITAGRQSHDDREAGVLIDPPLLPAGEVRQLVKADEGDLDALVVVDVLLVLEVRELELQASPSSGGMGWEALVADPRIRHQAAISHQVTRPPDCRRQRRAALAAPPRAACASYLRELGTGLPVVRLELSPD